MNSGILGNFQTNLELPRSWGWGGCPNHPKAWKTTPSLRCVCRILSKDQKNNDYLNWVVCKRPLKIEQNVINRRVGIGVWWLQTQSESVRPVRRDVRPVVAFHHCFQQRSQHDKTNSFSHPSSWPFRVRPSRHVASRSGSLNGGLNGRCQLSHILWPMERYVHICTLSEPF